MYLSILPMFRCLKLEKNVPVLMDAVYIITMLLPIVPDGMVKYFDDIFESLLRLMKLAFYNEGKSEFLLSWTICLRLINITRLFETHLTWSMFHP